MSDQDKDLGQWIRQAERLARMLSSANYHVAKAPHEDFVAHSLSADIREALTAYYDFCEQKTGIRGSR